MMQGRGLMNNDWMTIKTGTIGPEIGIGHTLGNAIDAPVMILKSCIGNRSLGWDLLPPGSERYEFGGRVYPAYKERPDSWAADPAKGKATEPPQWLDKNGKPIQWYAGKQYDDDTADAKKVLADIGTYYPGATKFEVSGFFFGRVKKMVEALPTPASMSRIWSPSSRYCARISTPPTRSSFWPRWGGNKRKWR